MPGSTDTVLAFDLKPGDTEIVLENEEGWQNDGAGHQRAWHGMDMKTNKATVIKIIPPLEM